MERDDERFERALRGLGATLDREFRGDPEAVLRRVRVPERPPRRGRRLGYAGLVAALCVLLVGVPWFLHGTFHFGPQIGPSGKEKASEGAVAPAAAEIASLGPVDFLDESRGFVAGTFRIAGRTVPGMLATWDGGRHFTLRRTAGWQLLALQFRGTSDGVAVGYIPAASSPETGHVAILQTGDGGRSWQVRWRGAASAALFQVTVQQRIAVAMFGDRGYAFDGGQILTSGDGGRSWTPLPGLPPGFTPVEADFLSGSAMFVAGQSCPNGVNGGGCAPLLVKSADGGRTFTLSLRPNVPAASYEPFGDSVTFADARHGFFYYKNGATMSATLYRTRDGGRTWTVLQAQFGTGRTVDGPLRFAGDQVGWLPIAQGAAPVPGALEVTADGGRTWRILGARRGWSIAYAQLLTPDTGFAVGGMGSGQPFLLRTTDGAKTFAQLLPALAPTGLLDFVNARTGFGLGIASDPALLVRTRDGGARWTEISRLRGGTPLAMSFPTDREGWAVVPSGTGLALLGTTDGGRRWSALLQDPLSSGVLAPDHPYLKRFAGGVGVLEDRSWPAIRMVSLSRGGRTFMPMQPIPAQPGSWSEVSFATAQYGFVAVSGERASGSPTADLYATSDGGSSWHALPAFPRNAVVNGIFFVTPHLGYAVATERPFGPDAQPALLRTEDGGQSWTVMPGRLSRGLQPIGNDVAVDFVSAREGFLLWQNGAYRTTDGGRSFQPLP